LARIAKEAKIVGSIVVVMDDEAIAVNVGVPVQGSG
jgi:hypothetical protein